MKIPCRKDCRQGPGHTRKDLCPIQIEHLSIILSLLFINPWDYVSSAILLKMQHLQNRFLHATGNIDRRTLVRELHLALNVPYV
jgi:hypothetical protein